MGKLAIVPGVLLLVLPPAPVAAQDRAPKFTIGAGAGIANPFHGDLSFTAATWEASVRGAAGRHVQIDAVAGEWIHERESLRLARSAALRRRVRRPRRAADAARYGCRRL